MRGPMMPNDDRPWFEQKRYGYGSGLPIAWQGWVALGLYIAVILGCGAVFEWGTEGYQPAAIAVGLAATIAIVSVSKWKTRGGWRWRWGKED